MPRLAPGLRLALWLLAAASVGTACSNESASSAAGGGGGTPALGGSTGSLGGASSGGITAAGAQSGASSGGTGAAGAQSGVPSGGSPAAGAQSGVPSGGSPAAGAQSGGPSGGTGAAGAQSGVPSGGTGAAGAQSAASGTGTLVGGSEASTGGEPGLTGGQSASGGAATGGIVDREQGDYPPVDPSSCGESWALVDNVCCAQYCSDDNTSDSCVSCGGNDSATCVAVHSKGCKSGKWPEVHAVTEDEPWHHSRSTQFGLTAAGACAYGLYSLCSSAVAFDADLQARCDTFCTAYPDLCADPAGTTLRGNYAAPQGNYYSQFWPSLPGDRDNYLSCGECFEVIRTRADGTEYAPGEQGYTPPIVLQIVDSCPCAANSKWCCGSGRDHCGEISDFQYGCPLPPGPPDPPPDHDPLPNESIHLDLSDIAMARLQSGDAAGGTVDGIIPIRYRRVPCPVVGNTYLWLHPSAGEFWFSLSVVNSAGLGSVVAVEARLPSGEWVALERDSNFVTSRPQERYGAWVLPEGVGPFELPVSIRLTSPSGEAIIAESAIKSWEPADPSLAETYYIDTGVQF
jgi:hypothetical protein